MRKIAGLIAVLIGCGASAALAQVAAPEIAPAAVRVYNSGTVVSGARLFIGPMPNVVPENPAALQWGTPSRLALGGSQGAKGDAYDGTANSHDGQFAGFRLVGARAGLAVEASNLEVGFPTGAEGVDPKLANEQRALALSVSWPESLAWGIGVENVSRDAVYATALSDGGYDERIAVKGTVFGVSWRLGEYFFIGGAYGRDEAERTVPTSSETSRRDHRMLGLGLRGGGKLVWHLELDHFSRDPFKTGDGTEVLSGYEMTQASGEAVLGGWLIGATAYSATDLALTGDTRQPELSGYTVDFGFAPLNGLVIAGRFEHSELATKTAFLAKEELNSVVLGWQF